MRNVLKSAKVEWHGWHAFRRGLATNLNHFGIDDSVIQVLLRHSDMAVTQDSYIRTVRPDVEAAMRRFSEALGDPCALSVLQTGEEVTVQ